MTLDAFDGGDPFTVIGGGRYGSGRPTPRHDAPTWEERMAARARDREHAQEATDAVERFEARRRAQDARIAAVTDPSGLRVLRGACDVCGQTVETIVPTSWVLDAYFTPEGTYYTYLMHPDGPLQPDCGAYAYRAYEVPPGR